MQLRSKHIRVIRFVAIVLLIAMLKPPYPKAEAQTQQNEVIATVPQQVSETPVQPLTAPVVEEVQPAPVVEAPVAPAPEPTVYHSDDFYMEYIFQHESSGNPYARNSIGCLGLGQACPGEKLLSVCPDLGDVACQVQFFSQYAIGRYGSWANAYAFWLNNHWW